MPIIAQPPNKLPEVMDPAQASVFDPLYKTLLRRATSLVGLDDPASMTMQAMAPAPLISIYKDAAERTVATKAFQDSAKPLGRNISRAANWFAQQYPRVAAHMSIAPKAVDDLSASAMAFTPPDVVKKPIPIVFTNLGIEGVNSKGGEAYARDLMAHEGTHAAQALGNRHNNDLYYLADRITGYANNPLEVTASARGEAAAQKLKRSYPGQIRNTSDKFGDILDRSIRAMKDRGVSLDQIGGGPKGSRIRLRKWGTPYGDPANLVDAASLNLPENVAKDLEILKHGRDAFEKSVTSRYTATRGLQNIAKKITPEAPEGVRRSFPDNIHPADSTLSALEQLLVKRAMMDK